MIQTFKDSPSESAWVSIHTYYTLFLLINILLASLFSVFVEILFCKAKGPGPLTLTTDLVARIWCSYHHDLASISGWEPKPPLWAVAGWGQWRSLLLVKIYILISGVFGKSALEFNTPSICPFLSYEAGGLTLGLPVSTSLSQVPGASLWLSMCLLPKDARP